MSERPSWGITSIRTLGPNGSNLEAASWEWFSSRGVVGTVTLHDTVEEAASALEGTGEAVMACAAYPALHDLVFKNLESLTIVDTFVMPTHRMVLAVPAGRREAPITSCAAHRAPSSLVPGSARWIESTSNSRAAIDCLAGLTDACITTSEAAALHGLDEVKDFGEVAMAFTLHAPVPA